MVRNDEEWKKLVIVHTLEQLKKYGIHAVTMDGIAAKLGMSKRTLYKMFGNKTSLVSACLNTWVNGHLDTQARGRVLADRLKEVEELSASEQLLRLVHSYIDELYKVNVVFLMEVNANPEWAILYKYYQKVWSDDFVQLYKQCVEEGSVADVGDGGQTAAKALPLIMHMRLEGEEKDTVRNFCITYFRGISLMNEEKFIHQTIL